jgi:serine/threonine protein kinase
MYAKEKLHPVCLRQIEREIAIHSQLSHPNIVSLYGAFEDRKFYYLVMEYANGVSSTLSTSSIC